jgi:opacity protein-like surface antigen
MTRSNISGILLAAALFVVTASSALAMDLGGHDRDGTVFGLVLGYGWNSIQVTPDGLPTVDSGNVGTFSGGARIGWAPSDNFIGSIGFYGWKKSYYTYSYTSTSASEYYFILEGAWFPRGEGFWLKGGIGRGTLDFNATAPLPKDSLIFNESGTTLVAGAGYEFRVSDGAAFGIAYDYIYLPVGDFAGFSDVSTTSHNLSLSLNFYIQ